MTQLTERRHDVRAPASAPVGALATRASTGRITASVTAELLTRGRYGGDRPAVAACVRRAVDELRGSVSLEALPEMAARLAVHRLLTQPMPQPTTHFGSAR